jgi:excisionase family DNA binding protein
MSLALVPMIDRVAPTGRAVFYEREAAHYLNVARGVFRQWVHGGRIPYTTHPGGKRRIYIKADLDEYLANLPRYRGEDPSNFARRNPRED